MCQSGRQQCPASARRCPKEQQHREVTVPVPSPHTCSLTGAVAVLCRVGGHLEKPSRSPVVKQVLW